MDHTVDTGLFLRNPLILENSQHSQRILSISASVGFTDFSQIDMLVVRYASVNFERKRDRAYQI